MSRPGQPADALSLSGAYGQAGRAHSPGAPAIAAGTRTVVIPDDAAGKHVSTGDLRNALVAARAGVRSDVVGCWLRVRLLRLVLTIVMPMW